MTRSPKRRATLCHISFSFTGHIATASVLLNEEPARERAPGKMKTNRFKDGRQGFSLNEVLIVLTMIGILVGVILPRLARTRAPRHPPSCVNNLKQIGLSFRIYANDNADRYPMEVPDSEGGAMGAVDRGEVCRIFQVMSNELSVPRTVICPADRRVAATNWTSIGNSNPGNNPAR